MRPTDPDQAAPAGRTASSSHLPCELRFLPVVGWMGLIFILSSRSRLPQPLGPHLTAVAGHVVVYAVLAILVYWGLACRGRAIGWHLALAFAVAVGYGLSDEWHQSFVPGRQPALFDIVMDTLGALLGLAATILWLRRSSSQRDEPHGELMAGDPRAHPGVFPDSTAQRSNVPTP
jgi:VanZ family protein